MRICQWMTYPVYGILFNNAIPLHSPSKAFTRVMPDIPKLTPHKTKINDIL